MPFQTESLNTETLKVLQNTLGPAEAREVISDFSVLVQKAIHGALLTLEKKDYDKFGSHCHQIKSNIAYIGGDELVKLCITIEMIVYEKDYGRLQYIEDDFKTCCVRALKDLKSLEIKPAVTDT